MKRETAEQWMLLEQSGELDPIRRALLRRHLARNPEDRNFIADADRIMRDARSLTDIPDISSQARAAIRIAAEERETDGTALRWQPALAFAVLAIALFGGWLVFRTPPAPQVAEIKTVVESDLAWDNGIDAEISELNSLLASSIDESDTTDLETIASELLELEGSEI